MLKIERPITLTERDLSAANLSEWFSEEDLKRIGAWVLEGYRLDKASRSAWERRSNAGMDLAMQLQRQKSFPWPNCSNVAFPLITIAIMQFHARAYSALVDGKDLVKMRLPAGGSPELVERAQRVGDHMSWQLLEEDESWEEQHDRLLIHLPVVGTAFKKTYPNPELGHNVSELVLAQDLVVNYWAKSLADAARKTHIIPQHRNDIFTKVHKGAFRDVLGEAWYSGLPPPRPDEQNDSRDKRKGVEEPQADETTPFITLEQHVCVDLDGDGYAEPWIITVEETSGCVLRMVTGFDSEDAVQRNGNQLVSIRQTSYFTKYGFIPSPDGGLYDIGFGVFLGPLNESVNTLVNQLIDAGTMKNAAGGFLAKGAKIRGGTQTFSPFGWNRVEATGDDLRKSMVPFTPPEPSEVLFRLLVLLIEYTNRIAGSVEMVVGENPGQNTPATTSQTVLEQGLKVYGAIFKRVWRSMKQEFRQLYLLNGRGLPERVPFGDGKVVFRKDYLGPPSAIVPAADPNVTSDNLRVQQAGIVVQRAQVVPGYNKDLAERNLLRAMRVEGADALFPGSESLPPPGPSEKVQIEQMRLEAKAQQLQLDKAMFVAELMETRRLNTAKIAQLESAALLALEQADEVDTSKQISLLQTMIGAAKTQNDALGYQIELALKGLEIKRDGKANEGTVGAVAEPTNNPVSVPAPGSLGGGLSVPLGAGGVL